MACTNKAATIPFLRWARLLWTMRRPWSLVLGSSGMAASSEPTLATIFEKMVCESAASAFEYYDFRPVGWLMARMTSDCERLSNILAWGILDLVWSFTIMIGVVIAMLVMEWRLALLILTTIPVILISLYFQKRILKSARLVRKTNSQITGSYNENIMGVLTARSS